MVRIWWGATHPAVELGGVVADVGIGLLKADATGLPVAELGHEPGGDGAAGLGDLGADAEHVEVHVHPVGHGLGVAVLHHQVLVEEGDGLDAGRGGEAHQEGVEVLQHLAPHAVDGAVALVDHDEVVRLDGHLRVVGHLHRLVGGGVEARPLVEVFGELLAPQDGVEALDGADVDFGGGLVGHVELRGGEAADVVELGELLVAVGYLEALELPDGLAAQVGPVDQEQDAVGPGVAQQPVADVGGGERLARAGGHLDQRPGAVGLERRLQVGDGLGLGRATDRGDRRPGRAVR